MTKSVEILERLVGFATVSRDSNLELIGFIEGFLNHRGIKSRLIKGPDRGKANLYATIGPDDRPGVMLSGHTDVVPVDGQDWSSDPFTMTKRDGKLFGRGTVDMKGFIACCLALIDRIDRQTLQIPLHLAFTFDEEVGCLGVRHLIEMLKDQPVLPHFCIVGEPTSMQIVTAHKGKHSFRAHCSGEEWHSSLAPKGKNAIHAAADLVQLLRTLQAEIEQSGPRDPDYDIPYTTVHAGVIQGGTALNIVPNSCTLDFEFRFLPSDPPDPLIRTIKRGIKDIEHAHQAPITLNHLSGYAGLNTPVDSEIIAFMRAITGGNSLGKISFGTEGGLISQGLNVPAIVCGPGHIERAHKPDEFIRLDELAACDAMLDSLAHRLKNLSGLSSQT